MSDEMNNNPESFDQEEELNSLVEGDIIEIDIPKRMQTIIM